MSSKVTTVNSNTTKVGAIKKVSQNELETILASFSFIKGASVIASIKQLTMPKTTKKCRDTKEPFFGMVEKMSKVSVFLNTEYARGVELQAVREQKKGLITSEHKKGVNTMPINLCKNNSFFGTYNGKTVIQYRPNTNNKAVTSYFLDGKEIEKNSLPNVLPIVKKATNQGITNEIFWRKLYVSNILEITLNNITYVVKK